MEFTEELSACNWSVELEEPRTESYLTCIESAA